MKIIAVRAVPFVLPYRRPFHMASGTISEAAHVLIRVETDEGVTGVAEAVARPMIYGESQASIVAAVAEWFDPALQGLDPFAVERAHRLVGSVAANETARGAVDIALHDIRGRALGQPTWSLLGAAAPDLRVAAMLGFGTPDEMAGEAAEAAEEHGVDAFKIKVGPDLAADVAAVTAVREAVGPGALLYIDANQSLSAEAALDVVRRTSDLGVEFVEEPVAADDDAGRALFAARSDVALLADESARSVAEAGRALTSGSARALSVKTARTGFTESARILGLARGLCRRTIIGSQGDSAVGTVAACTFGAAFAATADEPAELHYFTTLGDQIVAEAPTLRAGRIAVDQSVPGNGVVIDDDKLAHYRTDR